MSVLRLLKAGTRLFSPFLQLCRRCCGVRGITGRVWRMIVTGNIAGIAHQFRRFLGLRGKASGLVPPSGLRSRLAPTQGDAPSAGVLRILFFSHDLKMEGAPISLFQIVTELGTRGLAKPAVVALAGGALAARYESSGVSLKIQPVFPEELSTKRRLRRCVAALAALIREYRPDLVFANTLHCFPAILAAAEANVPSVWNVRESTPCERFFAYLPDAVAIQAVQAMALPERVVFVSRSSRGMWSDYERCGNFCVIHNGIDSSRFPELADTRSRHAARHAARRALGLADETLLLLSVGTLTENKGHHDLLRAVAFWPEEWCEHLAVRIVGSADGGDAKKILAQWRSMPAPQRNVVEFLPPTPEIGPYYAAADIFVFCSREESFPRVIVEAMAFGLPIITTPVNGVPEQVCENENAFFYPAGDVRALAGLIGRLATDSQLRLDMAAQSLKCLQKLTTFEGMIAAYAEVCRKAVERK